MVGSVQDLKIRLTVENGQAKATIDQTKSSFKGMTDAVSDGAHGANEALDNLNEKVDELGHHFEALETLGKAFLTFEGLKHLVESLVETNIEFQQLHYTLLAATGSTQGAAREMDFLWGVADRLGTKMETMAHIYGTYANAAKQAGIDTATSRKVFESVAEAGTVFHLSTDQMTSAMLALDQMMGEGIITSQNLRLQLGQALPGAYESFVRIINAKGLDFKKVIKGGGLDVKTFLPDLGKAISQTYNADALTKSTQGLNAELGRLSNAILKIKLDFADSDFANALTPLVHDGAAAVNTFSQLLAGVGGSLTVWAAVAGGVTIAGKGISKLVSATKEYATAFADAVRAETGASAARLARLAQETEATRQMLVLRAQEAEQQQLLAAVNARSAEAKQASLVVEEKQAQLQVERIRGNASLQGSTDALAAAEANLSRIHAEQAAVEAQVTKARADETAAIAENAAAKAALTEATGTLATAEASAAEATEAGTVAHAANTTALEGETAAAGAAATASEGLALKSGMAATAAGGVAVAARGLIGVLGGIPGVVGLAVVALGALIFKAFRTSDALRDLENQAAATKKAITSLAGVQAAIGVAQGKLNDALKASGGKETDEVLQRRADLAAAIRASASSAADYAQRDHDLEVQIGTAQQNRIAAQQKLNQLTAEHKRLSDSILFSGSKNPIADTQRMEQIEVEQSKLLREIQGYTNVEKQADDDLTANSVKNSAARRQAIHDEATQHANDQRSMATAEAERIKKEAEDKDKELAIARASTAEAIKLQQQVALAAFQKKGQYAVDKNTGRAVDPVIRQEEQVVLDATAKEVTAEHAKADAAKATAAARKESTAAAREERKEQQAAAKGQRESVALDSEEQAGLRRLVDIQEQADQATQQALPWDQKHDEAIRQLTDTYNSLIEALNRKLAQDPKNIALQQQVSEAAKEYAHEVDLATAAIDRERDAEKRLAQQRFDQQIQDEQMALRRDRAVGNDPNGYSRAGADAQAAFDLNAAHDQLSNSLHDLNANSGYKPGDSQYQKELDQIFERYQLTTKKIQDTWDKTTDSMRGITLQLGEYMRDNLGSFIEDALKGNFKNIADAWKNMLIHMIADFLSKRILDLIDQMTAKVKTLNSTMQQTGSGVGGSGGGFWSTVFSWIGSLFGGGHAEGGPISGPGTSTSDSIVARLSDGEFVVKAAAVQRYGVAFLSALNNMQLPASPKAHFATGGLVGSGFRSPDFSAEGEGGGTIVNVNNYSSEPAEVVRRRTPTGQEQIDIIVGKVAQSVRENGPVGQAIQGTFGVGRRGRS